MSIAIIAPNRDRSPWVKYFAAVDKNIKVEIWPDITDSKEVTCVLVWKHPPRDLLNYPNLKLICSMGAGVDHILADPDLPIGVPISKVVDNQLSRDMSNYIINGIINYQRDFVKQYEARQKGKWLDHHLVPKKISIGILGLGVLGQDVARKLTALDFNVRGFSNRPKKLDGIKCYSQSLGEMDHFLEGVNVLVCMLPLTPETKGILNIDLFHKLNPGTYLINVARGQHLVDEDLMTALDEGSIAGALLDVFHEEPLPKDHPFWSRDEIMITPHNASVTNPGSVAEQIVENYYKIGTNEPFNHIIDLKKGY